MYYKGKKIGEKKMEIVEPKQGLYTVLYTDGGDLSTRTIRESEKDYLVEAMEMQEFQEITDVPF